MESLGIKWPEPQDTEFHVQTVQHELTEDGTLRVIPINPEPTMFNPDDANAVSRFFQSIADKVVLASTLAKEMEELRAVVNQLKTDVEMYRETNARLDEEVARLRSERQALQDENATLRHALDDERREHNNTKEYLNNSCNERDRWHNDFIQSSTDLAASKQLADDLQMRIMQLEDDLQRVQIERNVWQRNAEDATNRIQSIHAALAA